MGLSTFCLGMKQKFQKYYSTEQYPFPWTGVLVDSRDTVTFNIHFDPV